MGEKKPKSGKGKLGEFYLGKKNKSHLQVTREEAAEFFAQLADSIRNNEDLIQGYDIPLSNYRKIKTSLKKKPEDYHLEIKVVTGEQEETEDEDLSFKKLKKRMEAYYEEMQSSLQDNYFPSREIVYVFLTDARTMTTFSGGYGEEKYEEFLDACEELRKAFEYSEFEELKQRFQQLGQMRMDCHAKYKD